MLKCFYRYEKIVIIKSEIFSTDEISTALIALIKDHPELFWVNYYSYILGTSGNNTYIKFNLFFSKEKISYWRKKLVEWKRRVYKQIPEKLSKLQIAWTLFDYLTRKVEFNNDNTPMALRQTPLGVINHQHPRAVCEGISKAYKLLCDELEIPCIVIFGDVYGDNLWTGHAWNMIGTEKGLFHIDATAHLKSSKLHGIAVRDFLMNDKDLAECYRWEQHLVPVCI